MIVVAVLFKAIRHTSMVTRIKTTATMFIMKITVRHHTMFMKTKFVMMNTIRQNTMVMETRPIVVLFVDDGQVNGVVVMLVVVRPRLTALPYAT